MFTQSQVSTLDTNLPQVFKDLLLDVVPEKEHSELITTDLSVSQQSVIELFDKGKNVLVLGSAGCGKSTVIKTIQQRTDKTIQLCSTTGISAYNIGGITIHSFMGFGTGEKPVGMLLSRILKNKNLRLRIQETQVLVIDEISMLSAELFEKIEYILRRVRNMYQAFGGIQMILCGDLLQLLPVFKRVYSKYNQEELDTRLIVESDIFKSEFTIDNTVVLKTNFRQDKDVTYANILEDLRYSHTKPEYTKVLLERSKTDLPKDIIHLVSTNVKANDINQENLKRLKGKQVCFNASFKSNCLTDTRGEEQEYLLKLYEKELESQFKQKDILVLKLKPNTRVMLIKNLDVKAGLVNGLLGTVKELTSSSVIVDFDNGRTHEVGVAEWELSSKDVSVVAIQIPLTVAYAITIHKSQSLTLERAVMDLGDCFAEHMVYVALSRVKSLDGLYLKTLNVAKIRTNKKMLDYLNKFN